ncbi:MAG: hypothetical protein N3A38_14285, partial [Planctomycetota bacterium]|nr:hypothetical protein [Planctomycetota bacterium]
RIALDVRIGRYAPLGLYDLIVPLATGGTAMLKEQIVLIVVDIDADSNRDGVVNDEDDVGEDTWGRERGAVVLVNCDDDDLPERKESGMARIDKDTTGDDGDEDMVDMARLIVKRIGLPQLLPRWMMSLRIEKPNLADDPVKAGPCKRVRIYRERGRILEHIIGGELPAEKVFSEDECREFLGEGIAEFRVEGLTHAAVVDIVFEVRDGVSVLGADRVRLMTSPTILLSNAEIAEKVYVFEDKASPFSLSAVVGRNLPDIVRIVRGEDRWFQDQWQFGFSSVPLTTESQVVAPAAMEMFRPWRGLEEWGRRMLLGPVPFRDVPHPDRRQPDDSFDINYHLIAYGMPTNNERERAGSAGYGGNLEVIPPFGEYPFRKRPTVTIFPEARALPMMRCGRLRRAHAWRTQHSRHIGRRRQGQDAGQGSAASGSGGWRGSRRAGCLRPGSARATAWHRPRSSIGSIGWKKPPAPAPAPGLPRLDPPPRVR